MALGSGGVICGHGIDLGSVGGGGGEDLLFVRLAICIDHRGIGTKAGATVLLYVSWLLAETANNGLGLTVVAISVESAEVGLNGGLPCRKRMALTAFSSSSVKSSSSSSVTGWSLVLAAATAATARPRLSC